ncbi:esterase/lipase family protein [uncultured Sphingomonas sp.]|uniref:esterase/lipase family protein n=1 Tax=uncultured Sphingomonas sp. TaxID=158754 RepID=UPI0035CC1403
MASAALNIKPSAAVRAPSALLAFTELPRAIAEWGQLALSVPALMASAPRGDGHPVLVLPGFMTTDTSTRVLRRFLKALGYDAHSWNLGRNLGPRAIGQQGEHLVARLREIHEATGQKVSLVGWSLGGVMARLLARRAPDAVRQVVTLGSPFAGSPKASNVWRLYELMCGSSIDDHQHRRHLAEVAAPPAVPTSAIYSKGDGVVAWQNCREKETELAENIEVHGSHCGLGVNPAVLYAVADRLARKEGDRRRFDGKRFGAWMYPAGDA